MSIGEAGSCDHPWRPRTERAPQQPVVAAAAALVDVSGAVLVVPVGLTGGTSSMGGQVRARPPTVRNGWNATAYPLPMTTSMVRAPPRHPCTAAWSSEQ